MKEYMEYNFLTCVWFSKQKEEGKKNVAKVADGALNSEQQVTFNLQEVTTLFLTSHLRT